MEFKLGGIVFVIFAVALSHAATGKKEAPTFDEVLLDWLPDALEHGLEPTTSNGKTSAADKDSLRDVEIYGKVCLVKNVTSGAECHAPCRMGLACFASPIPVDKSGKVEASFCQDLDCGQLNTTTHVFTELRNCPVNTTCVPIKQNRLRPVQPYHCIGKRVSETTEHKKLCYIPRGLNSEISLLGNTKEQEKSHHHHQKHQHHNQQEEDLRKKQERHMRKEKREEKHQRAKEELAEEGKNDE